VVGAEAVDDFDERVADVFDVIVPFLVESGFEGENDEHFVDCLADLAYAAFFPGPYLGRNIIDNPKSLRAGPFGDAHVEAGIVNENERIGAILEDVLLAEVKVAEDGAEVHQHFGKAHKGKFFIVPDEIAACGCHKVAAPAADGSGGVEFF
jgi:hypothetical protein